MCCCRSKIAKCLITTFSVGTILGGLTIVALGFWLILNADSLLGSSSNDDGTVSFGDLAKRVTIVSAIIGGVAIVFGIIGILVAKTQKTVGICLFGFLSFIMMGIISVSAYALI